VPNTLSEIYEGNFRQLGIKRLPGYLRNSPRIQALMRSLLGGVQLFEDDVWGVLEGSTLGLSSGASLDQWGILVGELRGSLSSDQEYLAIIEARILANRCDGTVDKMMEVLERAAAPHICMESFEFHPAGFQIQVARERWMGEARRGRVRRILDDITPVGRDATWVEAIHGGFGPPTSCNGNTFTGPLSRVI
jgi:hypothetical protein